MTDTARQFRFRKLFESTRVVIFDFDGVLADSEKFHFRSYRDVFRRYGHEVDETEYYRTFTSLGTGPRGEIDRYGLNLDPAVIRKEKGDAYSGYCQDGSIKLFAEAHEILERLAGTDKVLTIASGSTRPDIEAILKNSGVSIPFAAIIGSDTVTAIKPAPDIFLAMLDAVDAEPYECLVIEDAEKGVQAAAAAAIPVVVVRTRETRDFEFPQASVVMDSHVELLEMVRGVT